MSALQAPSPEPAGRPRGRAIGIGVGASIAFGWCVYATAPLTGAARIGVLIAAAAITGALLLAASRMLRVAGGAALGSRAEGHANRRAWRLFWLNLAGEIILLNIALNLLAASDLQRFWIPAISLVVGLHFLPMAVFFRQRSYWWVGGAMIAAAAVTALAIARQGDASLWAHGEGMANALILWGALAVGAAL